MKRFALIAGTVAGNRGAEAMLETSVGRLRDREPDAKFVVYSYLPESDRVLITDPGIVVHSCTPAQLVLVLFPLSLLLAALGVLGLRRAAARIMPASVRGLASCDALIDLAGVSFIDGREKFLPFNLLTLWPAMLLGVPVFKLSQAMGPFRHAVTRAASRTLWRCRMVVPRGAGTLEHLREAEFPPSLTYPAPDIAFGFEVRDALSLEGSDEATAIIERAATLRAEGVTVVGLCPSSVIAGKAAEEGWDYIGFLVEVTSDLLAAGSSVVLFPNATRAASAKLRNNDLPVIAQVSERVADVTGRLLAVRGDMAAAPIRLVVEACDVVAVSRFHAMVGALSACVPVAVMGWSHKYAEVMQQFGLEEWVYDYSARDAVAFVARVHELLGRRTVLAEQIGRALPEVRGASIAQFDEMLRRL